MRMIEYILLDWNRDSLRWCAWYACIITDCVKKEHNLFIWSRWYMILWWIHLADMMSQTLSIYEPYQSSYSEKRWAITCTSTFQLQLGKHVCQKESHLELNS